MQSAPLLLVEDEDVVRSLLEETLRDAGFELKIAGNGVDAIAILESESETVRGLITDINLGWVDPVGESPSALVNSSPIFPWFM